MGVFFIYLEDTAEYFKLRIEEFIDRSKDCEKRIRKLFDYDGPNSENTTKCIGYITILKKLIDEGNDYLENPMEGLKDILCNIKNRLLELKDLKEFLTAKLYEDELDLKLKDLKGFVKNIKLQDINFIKEKYMQVIGFINKFNSFLEGYQKKNIKIISESIKNNLYHLNLLSEVLTFNLIMSSIRIFVQNIEFEDTVSITKKCNEINDMFKELFFLKDKNIQLTEIYNEMSDLRRQVFSGKNKYKQIKFNFEMQ